MSYQLILKNRHVLDPGQGIDRRADIAVADGRIAAIDDSIPGPPGATVLGRFGISPVQTVRDGVLIAPHRGTRPWGWLPATAAASAGASA